MRTLGVLLRNTTSSLKCIRTQFNIQTCRFMSSVGTNMDLSGIYPPIPTPFEENEDIAWEQLTHNLAKWEKVPFKGYVVQGSNGEYVSLSHEERVDMVKFVRDGTAKEKLILAGSGCEGTRETLRLTVDMAKAGADAALIATPSFFKSRMNSAAMMKHYLTIADASPIPVILYNVPSNTGIDFPLDAIIKLSKHPNIIGLKDSSGNVKKGKRDRSYSFFPIRRALDASLLMATSDKSSKNFDMVAIDHGFSVGSKESRQTGTPNLNVARYMDVIMKNEITNIGSIVHDTRNEDFQVIAGSASFLMASLQLGAVGGICALANVLGDECCQLFDLSSGTDVEAAKKHQLKLIAPNQAVTRKYNVPALKYAMELYGFYGGPARSPLTPLTESEKKDVRECFDDFFVI